MYGGNHEIGFEDKYNICKMTKLYWSFNDWNFKKLKMFAADFEYPLYVNYVDICKSINDSYGCKFNFWAESILSTIIKLGQYHYWNKIPKKC